MGRRPDHPDAAGAIIKYFRDACATSNTDGVETNAIRIASAIGANTSTTAAHLKRMLAKRIVILKKGIHEVGYKGPKAFALGDGYEDGDGWRSAYFEKGNPIKNRPTTLSTSNGHPLLASKVLESGARAVADKGLMTELIGVYAQVDELQKKLLAAQEELRKTVADNAQKTARIQELEEDIQVTTATARQSAQDVADLELTLRQARSQVAAQSRQISRNETGLTGRH